VALVRAIPAVEGLRLPEDRKVGAGIVASALSEPLRQIAHNAGHESSIVFNQVKEGKGDFGFNASTEEFEGLDAAGVIDPAKVVRSALENAVSAASLLITTEAAVAEKPKKPAPMPAMPPGGGMGGMGGMGGAMGGMGGMDDFGGDDF
jgi:chaperonin GroEL